jgi:hypothetical protein
MKRDFPSLRLLALAVSIYPDVRKPKFPSSIRFSIFLGGQQDEWQQGDCHVVGLFPYKKRSFK